MTPLDQPAPAPDPDPDPDSDPTARLLRSIEADGLLRLPPGGPELSGLRFGADALQPAASRATTPPPWWCHGRASLRGASLAGARLLDADFSGADLTGATFAATTMRSARLAAARLDGACFAGADMSGVDLTGAEANEADFTRAMLEDARLTGATARFADFTGAVLDGANLDRADLHAAKLDGVEAMSASFRGAVLHEAALTGADFSNADLTGAELKKADARGVRLRGADLRGADLRGANLAGADLSGASLPRVDLTGCTLHGVRLAGAWLENTRFAVAQLGGGLGEQLAGEFTEARQGYLTLEQNFRGLGDPETARWCYLRARRMGKRGAFASLRAALRTRHWRALPLAFGTWFGDAFAEWLCDYGESLPRVLRAFATAVAGFALVYLLSGSLVHTAESDPALTGQPSHDVLLLLGFSFLNMCTSGTPDIGIKPATHLVYFVSGLQYVTGLVLIGLFGYVLGNRIRR